MELKDTRYNSIRLTFEEEGHKYYDSLGNTYISTTTILHSFQPEFDKKYWLKKKSKELGISEKHLEEQWNTITKEACARGTKTHNGLEDGIKGSSMFKNAIKYLCRNDSEMTTIADIPNINNIVKPLDVKEFIDMTEGKYPQIYEVFNNYLKLGYTIYSEIGMFLIDYLVSGTIDVLLIRDDKFVIGDWKTNRGGLQFKSGYYKKDKSVKPAQMTNEFVETKEMLLPPVANLPKCNGAIYNLQLSLYAKAVEMILGIPCVGLWLCHIDSDFVLNEYGMPKRFPDGLYHIKDNPVETTKFYKMRYLSDEIDRIFRDRLKVVKATRNNSFNLFD